MRRFHELVEEIIVRRLFVVGVVVGEEDPARGDGQAQRGEEGVDERGQVRVRRQGAAVRGQEAEEGEQRLPEQGPVVREPRAAGGGEVGEQPVQDARAGGVEGDVEATAQVVR